MFVWNSRPKENEDSRKNILHLPKLGYIRGTSIYLSQHGLATSCHISSPWPSPTNNSTLESPENTPSFQGKNDGDIPWCLMFDTVNLVMRKIDLVMIKESSVKRVQKRGD